MYHTGDTRDVIFTHNLSSSNFSSGAHNTSLGAPQLGEIAVSFAFGPPLEQKESDQVWPIYVLWGNGDVYSLHTSLRWEIFVKFLLFNISHIFRVGKLMDALILGTGSITDWDKNYKCHIFLSYGAHMCVCIYMLRIFLNKCAIWCVLKCILIKFQGKNSLKILVFIATTTKKATSLLGEGGVGTGAYSPG